MMHPCHLGCTGTAAVVQIQQRLQAILAPRMVRHDALLPSGLHWHGCSGADTAAAAGQRVGASLPSIFLTLLDAVLRHGGRPLSFAAGVHHRLQGGRGTGTGSHKEKHSEVASAAALELAFFCMQMGAAREGQHNQDGMHYCRMAFTGELLELQRMHGPETA
ncbi:hypothetical protein ABPG75_000854 [Micractinium tetrahymenae]